MQCTSVEEKDKYLQTVGRDANFSHGQVKESPQSQLRNILNEICQFNFANSKPILKTNPMSCGTEHQSNVTEKCSSAKSNVITSSIDESCIEGKTERGFSFRVGSDESVYMIAEQTDANDAEESWVTESCYSDSSPTATLTKLNAK